jgi:hypothetical protein
MNMPLLIGLTGKAGAGKDTAAAGLICQHGYVRIAFADPIRRSLQVMLNLDSSAFEHPVKELPLRDFGKSPRQMMQTLGTEWGRQLIHSDIWLMVARESIERTLSVRGRVVVTDVRFENEATMIRSLGGTIWHIDRDAAGTAHAHTSESGVAFDPATDMRIDNNASVGDLYRSIDNHMGEIA